MIAHIYGLPSDISQHVSTVFADQIHISPDLTLFYN